MEIYSIIWSTRQWIRPHFAHNFSPKATSFMIILITISRNRKLIYNCPHNKITNPAVKILKLILTGNNNVKNQI